jgi:hypothetical protein
MRGFLTVMIGIVVVSSAALADGMSLAGSLWHCTRATDQSQFVITFYPGGGVGGGEFQNDEVSPYIFDPLGQSRGNGPGGGTRQAGVSHGLFQIRGFGLKAASQDLARQQCGSAEPKPHWRDDQP